MKKTINSNDFINEFKSYGRSDQFSKEGLKALFDYFTQYEEETGNEIELDVIAICTEYTEYADLGEFNAEYPSVKSIEELRTNFVYIPFAGGFIIQNQ